MRNFKQFKCQLQSKRGFKVPVICPYWSSKHDPRWMLIQDRWHSKGTITKSLYIFNTNKLSRYVVATLPILYNYNYCFIWCGLGNKGVWFPTLELSVGFLRWTGEWGKVEWISFIWSCCYFVWLAGGLVVLVWFFGFFAFKLVKCYSKKEGEILHTCTTRLAHHKRISISWQQ